MKKYNKWLGTDYNFFFRKPDIKRIPEPLDACEQLFDKNVLEIKKLLKDIGDLTTLIHKEQKKFFYMMTAILLLIHFLARLIK